MGCFVKCEDVCFCLECCEKCLYFDDSMGGGICGGCIKSGNHFVAFTNLMLCSDFQRKGNENVKGKD